MAKSLKFGYEGEGPMLGRRTVYASFPEVSVKEVAEEATKRRVDSVYFVVDSHHEEFVSSLTASTLVGVRTVTLDFPLEFYQFYNQFSSAILFVRCGLATKVADIPVGALKVGTYFKLVCEKSFEMKEFVDKANQIAELGPTVLLMPDFWMDAPGLLGEEMMGWFDHLHPRVRMMPPVHHVLRMS